MSESVRAHLDDRKIELEPAVNWYAIAAAISACVAALAIAVVLGLLAVARAAPEKEQPLARRNNTPPSVQTANWPAPPVPWSQMRESLPRPEDFVTAPKPENPKPLVVVKKPSAPKVEATSQPTVPDESIASETTEPAKVAAALPSRFVSLRTRSPGHSEEGSASVRPPFKRLKSRYTEDMLLDILAKNSRELDIETEKGTSAKLLDEVKKMPRKEERKPEVLADTDSPHPLSPAQPVLELFARRDDLKGLPVRKGAECQIGATEAKVVQRFSNELRSTIAKLGRVSDSSSNPRVLQERDATLTKYVQMLGAKGAHYGVTPARTLVQMLQTESVPVRQALITQLSTIEGDKAGSALAQRAVFDLSFEVREAAVQALKDRPPEDYRPTLLAALRYPWAPVADHAAEALVNLDDREAVFDLARLLDKPDPEAPVQDQAKKWVTAELVKVNHLGNCLLCHAPSFDRNDPVRGLVPERGKPLPELYYASEKGTLVRADVTYLKQDFSVIQPVKDHDKWPALQRFDYLVRQRELNTKEVACLTTPNDDEPAKPSTYPQREAVVWALCQLTGAHVGDKSEDWYLFLLGQGQ